MAAIQGGMNLGGPATFQAGGIGGAEGAGKQNDVTAQKAPNELQQLSKLNQGEGGQPQGQINMMA